MFEAVQWFWHLLTEAHMARSLLKDVEKESLKRPALVFIDSDSLGKHSQERRWTESRQEVQNRRQKSARLKPGYLNFVSEANDDKLGTRTKNTHSQHVKLCRQPAEFSASKRKMRERLTMMFPCSAPLFVHFLFVCVCPLFWLLGVLLVCCSLSFFPM